VISKSNRTEKVGVTQSQTRRMIIKGHLELAAA